VARIEQRGTSWRVQWRLGGKRGGAVQSITFVSAPGAGDGPRQLALAAKQLAESRNHAVTRAEVERAVLGEQRAVLAGVPTLAEWTATWLADRAGAKDIQPDTLARYRQTLNQRVLPQLGHLRLTEIGQQTIRDWIAWANTQTTRPRGSAPGRPLSAQTVRRAHAVLHQVLGAAVGTWIPTNPAAKQVGMRKNSLGLPKATRFEGMFLEIWELNAILDCCCPTMRDIATVLVRTGLRLGELLVLRVQDVTLGGRHPRIKVCRALKDDGSIGDPKSESSFRDVHISGEPLEILRRRAAGRGRTDLLFPAPKGAVWCPNNLRQRLWLPAVAEAQRCAEHPPALPPKPKRGPRRKLRLNEVSTCACRRRLARAPRLHDLRHTHVSGLVEAGWEPKQIQVRVGHASFQVTMDIYGHLWNHGHAERLDALERVFMMADDEAA
jgi:integrase